MATAEVVPNVGSSAPAAESTSAPASGETTESSTPSTSSTTTVTAPEVPTGDPAKTRLPRNEGESDLEWLARNRAEREKKAGEPAKPEPVKKVEEQVTEQFKPKTEEPKPAEQKTAETPAEDDGLIKEEDLSLEELGIMSPKDLNDLAKQNASLAKAFEDSPELKGRLMSTLRKAGDAAEFLGIFPDKEAANFARDEATVFTGFRDSFTGQTSIDDTRGLLEKIAGLTVQVDENGSPVKDAQGNFVQDGSFFKFMDNIRSIDMEFWADQAKKTGDEELSGALDVLRARTSRSAPAQEDMPAELKAQWEKLNQEKSQIETQKQQEHVAQQKASDSRVGETIDAHIDKRWKEIESKFSAPKIVLEAARGKAQAALEEKLVSNTMFTSQRDLLARLPISGKSEERRAKLITNYIDKVFVDTVRPILKEAGAQVMGQAEKQNAAQAELQKASRSEIKGAGIPAGTPQPQSAKEFAESMRKQNPNVQDAEIIAKWRGAKSARG